MTTWVEEDMERIEYLQARIERIKKQENTQARIDRIKKQENAESDYDDWIREQRELTDLQNLKYQEWYARIKIAQMPLTITRYGVYP